jgi:hypothetical protein
MVMAATLAGIFVAATPHATGEPIVCTAIGCSSGVSLDVKKVPKGATKLTFCVADRCRRVGLDKKFPTRIGCDGGTSASVSVIARDAENRKVARLSRQVPLTMQQPNGPDCPPTCFVGHVRLDGKKLVLMA